MSSNDYEPRILSEEEIDVFLKGDPKDVNRIILYSLNRLAAVLIPAALFCGRTGTEKALLIACVLLVLIVELINSAVEAVVDRVSLERHELAGRAKDIGSAAVLIALINLAVVWGLVLFG